MIDVKKLRIGSHVSVGGVRKRIDHIGINGELGEIYISNPEWTKERQSKERSEHTWFCTQIDPIPLTAELLQELGFEQEQSYFILTLPDEVTIYADAVEDEMGNWNIQVFATKLYKCGEIFVRYLNELESFIYLTIGKELVE